MSEPAVKKIHLDRKDARCPRDRVTMRQLASGQAILDVCGTCGGQYFDSGEMFAAFGLKADPSYWDRPETGGSIGTSALKCPACNDFMLAQEVKYAGERVEIDRCGKCGGIWLDKGEVDTIMKICDGMRPILDQERAKAREELDKMGDVDLSSPGLIGRFLALFSKK